MSEAKPIAGEEAPIEKVKTTKQIRDEYRTSLVGNKLKIRTKTITFQGREIELREPKLGDTLHAQTDKKGGDQSTAYRTVSMIIQYCYIPGTDTQIFEEADRPQIMNWPFGVEYMKLQDAMNEMVGIDVEEAKEDLKANPLADTSSSTA